MAWRTRIRRTTRRTTRRQSRPKVADFEIGDEVKISNPITHGHGKITGVLEKHSHQPQKDVYRVKLDGKKEPIKALGVAMKKE